MLRRMRPDRFAALLVIAVVAAIVFAIAWQSVPLIQSRLLGLGAEPRLVAARGELAGDEQATIELFEARRASVVYISTEARVIDPWTRNVHEMPRGTGSGFIWDDLGHVITNNHVIQGASRAYVRLADGRTFEAGLVGADPTHDIAVLQIGVASDRPEALPIGTSADLKVGQKVFAIGNPFGLDWTLTTGIVSALERELPEEGGRVIRGLIQTDAAINPGNSGGPLLDSAGRLIGMNTAIFSPSGAYAGIGFAVPVDTINRVVPQLIARGRYEPPSLGVRVDPRADALARRAGIEGVLILRVDPGTPAEAAGLRPARITADGRLDPGDVIIGLAGSEVESVENLRALLDLHRVGDSVSLTVLREGEPMEFQITLGRGA
jgi:S1-C subfamily serine protease